VDRGAGRACGLDLNDFIVRADAAADEGADSKSFLYSEVGDSHDSMDEAAGVAEDDAVAASGRVQRQTCPVYKTALTEQRLKRWMKSRAIQGELVGNIGCIFGNWGSLPENSSERERVLVQLKTQPAHILCLAEADEIVEATLRLAPHEDAGKHDDTSSAIADELAARKPFE
jgi:hypothetical protein